VNKITTRILGIDPGLIKTGWGIIEYSGNSLRFIACGLIKPDNTMNLAKRLLFLSEEINKIILAYQPTECAIEETFVNKNAMSSLKLGHARGALMLTVSSTGIPLFEYAATLVKKSVTGVGRAEKNQVAMMVKQLMPLAKIDSEDAADALAVAICHTSHITFNRTINSKTSII
jgi:crossover junction endodeoxyribonuclease RuvC